MRIRKRDLVIMGFLYTVAVFYAVFTGDFSLMAGVGLGFYVVIVLRYLEARN